MVCQVLLLAFHLHVFNSINNNISENQELYDPISFIDGNLSEMNTRLNIFHQRYILSPTVLFFISEINDGFDWYFTGAVFIYSNFVSKKGWNATGQNGWSSMSVE